MRRYIVFRRGYQYIVHAESVVRAIQTAMLHGGGVADDWVCHQFSSYPQHLQARLTRESVTL